MMHLTKLFLSSEIPENAWENFKSKYERLKKNRCHKKYWKQEVDKNTTKGLINIEFYPKTAAASGQQMAKC